MGGKLVYASNEYFLPVMGLIFLRHAYSRFLAVKASIEATLPTRGGKPRALTKEDFSQRGAIFLRPAAQFDQQVAPFPRMESDQAGLPVAAYTETDVKEKMEEVFRHVYRAYPVVPSPFYDQAA